MILLQRRNPCLTCFNTVVESVHQILSDTVPDQNNCDLSEYKDYCVTGGRLLGTRVTPLDGSTTRNTGPAICSDCLKDTKIRKLIDFYTEKLVKNA